MLLCRFYIYCFRYLFCMPCMTTYLESASGVEAGGKTGLTAVATSFIFILMFLITPLALMIPSAATAPTLILMGVKNVGWNEKYKL